MTVSIRTGDCLDVLRTLPDESVHCCVTSPPYYGLRDYGVDGAIGLEASPDLHIAKLVEVFHEVRRVLRKDGTCWVNYGDAYASSPRGNRNPGGGGLTNSNNGSGVEDARWRAARNRPVPEGWRSDGLKPKDLMMMPARLALALQADGWWLRSEIVWAKPNPMPESVTDRPTSAHEKLYLLAKSGSATTWKHRDGGATNKKPPPDYRWKHRKTGEEHATEQRGKEWQRINLWRGQDYYYDAEAVREADRGTDHVRNILHKPEPSGGLMSPHDGIRTAGGRNGSGRNLRNVWTIATAPFPDAHFATFPPALVEPCIKAGTSEKGVCANCGAPWVREVERTAMVVREGPGRAGLRDASPAATARTAITGTILEPATSKTLGWSPSCACNAATVPATVLDPFGGSGTTALIADRLRRNAILIELNPEYAEMACQRVSRDAGMFAEVGA